ncbi:MAG: sugar-binding domain-containing protein [Verrucomicrobiota bacterium]
MKELQPPPGESGWKPFAVPGVLRGYDYERAWFRRAFTPPATMRGKRVRLNSGGVKFNSQVYLNGKQVGGCFGGYQPFEIDVTEALRFDGPNELLVGCHDLTGVFSPGKVDFSRARGASSRDVPRDNILSPVGGLFECYGIWDDVMLLAQEPIYVKALIIKPSVRHRELVVECTAANESAADAELDKVIFYRR